jgi:spermidine synthase
LVAGALASYLLGDSVTQFSTIIGTYLFAMGVGSWLSRFVVRGLAARFVQVQLLLAVVGGFSSTALFLAFAYTDGFRLLLYVTVLVIGTLVGLEIPLLMRLLKGHFDFRDVVAHVLTFDYLGALVASLLFPLLMLPWLGLARTSLLFGLVNAGVALWSCHLFRDALGARRILQATSVAVLLALSAGMVSAERLTRMAESSLYADQVVFTRDSRYQRIVLTARQDDLRLFLNGHLQFSSRDEYRYHESLVHPGLAALVGGLSDPGRSIPLRVLVLGGGDGMAVREALKYPGVSVTLVELDPVMTTLFATHTALTPLNEGALRSERVRIVNADAFVWLTETDEVFDFIVADFPDPSTYAVGKLYTTAFYRLVRQHLSDEGMFVVQATSPMFAPRAYWSIDETLRAAGFRTWPYHVYVPSFGEWGFVLGREASRPAGARAQADGGASSDRDEVPAGEAALPADLRFLTPRILPQLFEFPRDMQPVDVEANTLDDPVLVRYYEADWRKIQP